MALADMRRRIDVQISAPSQGSDPPDVIKAIALSHLEDDDTVTRLLRAIAQFRVTSEHDQSVRALIVDNEAYYISTITQSLREGHDRHLLHPLIDPELEGPIFWALINALATDVALGLRAREEARTLLRYHFVRLARSARVTKPTR